MLRDPGMSLMRASSRAARKEDIRTFFKPPLEQGASVMLGLFPGSFMPGSWASSTRDASHCTGAPAASGEPHSLGVLGWNPGSLAVLSRW